MKNNNLFKIVIFVIIGFVLFLTKSNKTIKQGAKHRYWTPIFKKYHGKYSYLVQGKDIIISKDNYNNYNNILFVDSNNKNIVYKKVFNNINDIIYAIKNRLNYDIYICFVPFYMINNDIVQKFPTEKIIIIINSICFKKALIIYNNKSYIYRVEKIYKINKILQNSSSPISAHPIIYLD